MLRYLDSKVIEYETLIGWLKKQLELLKPTRKDHEDLVLMLGKEIDDTSHLLNLLKIIALIRNSRYYKRAIPIIHILENRCRAISNYYIPALQREREEDLWLRRLMISNVKRLGLSWIKDVAVRLDGPHAIFSQFPDIPVIYAPPESKFAILTMLGGYHELGHNVFIKHGQLANDLLSAISSHYSQLKSSAGPMSPEKKIERDRGIENARKYWDISRINEIFSDIFAALICGPSFYFGIVNMAISIGGNPFQINMNDIHPPLAARVEASNKTLSEIYDSDEIVNLIRENWDSYKQSQVKGADYDLLCSDEVISVIVDMAINGIKNHFGEQIRYKKPLPSQQPLNNIAPDKSFEEILNFALAKIMKEPKKYKEWHDKIVREL